MSAVRTKPWLRTGEAAKLLGVDGSTVRRWCSERRIKSRLTPGGQHQIAREDLDRFVAAMAAALPAPLSVAS